MVTLYTMFFENYDKIIRTTKNWQKSIKIYSKNYYVISFNFDFSHSFLTRCTTYCDTLYTV